MYEVSPGVYESSLGIVEKTDTATHAITSGQAVIWKGNVKIASSNISVGDTLSSSNLSDPSNGEFNKLSTDIGNVDAKVGTLSSLTTTAKTNIVAAVNELDSDLGTLSGNITQLIATDSFTTDSVTIASGDRGVFTKSVTKTGYTALGIVQIGLANNWLEIGSFNISNNSVQIVLHNKSASSQTTTITFVVLYKKTN